MGTGTVCPEQHEFRLITSRDVLLIMSSGPYVGRTETCKVLQARKRMACLDTGDTEAKIIQNLVYNRIHVHNSGCKACQWPNMCARTTGLMHVYGSSAPPTCTKQWMGSLVSGPLETKSYTSIYRYMCSGMACPWSNSKLY